jgi:hypothetical protein
MIPQLYHYDAGWLTIYQISAFFAINMGIVWKEMLHSMHLILIKYGRLAQRFLSKLQDKYLEENEENSRRKIKIALMKENIKSYLKNKLRKIPKVKATSKDWV